ncbi:MAG: hypothetical protein ABIA47_01070 [bacterium]
MSLDVVYISYDKTRAAKAWESFFKSNTPQLVEDYKKISQVKMKLDSLKSDSREIRSATGYLKSQGVFRPESEDPGIQAAYEKKLFNTEADIESGVIQWNPEIASEHEAEMLEKQIEELQDDRMQKYEELLAELTTEKGASVEQIKYSLGALDIEFGGVRANIDEGKLEDMVITDLFKIFMPNVELERNKQDVSKDQLVSLYSKISEDKILEFHSTATDPNGLAASMNVDDYVKLLLEFVNQIGPVVDDLTNPGTRLIIGFNGSEIVDPFIANNAEENFNKLVKCFPELGLSAIAP